MRSVLGGHRGNIAVAAAAVPDGIFRAVTDTRRVAGKLEV